MKQIIVSSYEQYNYVIEKYDKDNGFPKECERGIFQSFYRGQADAAWNIVPSITRTKNPTIEEKSRLDNYLWDGKETLFQVMAHIQHYQTGTRMIDFSLSHKIALYFACKNNECFDKNRAVFIYSICPHREEWYTVPLMLEIAKIENDEYRVRDLSLLLCEKYDVFKKRFKSIGEIDNAITAILDFGLMVVPNQDTYENNPRMKAQNGCLWICGNEFSDKDNKRLLTNLTSCNAVFYPHKYVVPFDNRNHLYKIVIPSKYKQGLLEQLEKEGISEKTLFPD